MSKGISVESKLVGTPLRKRRDRISAIVAEIEKVGPNMAEVARRLEEPKESVSYIFRSIIEKNGYLVQARVDSGALGLRNAMAVVDIGEQYSPYLGDIFDNMDEYWFLNGFGRTLPDGKYVLHFGLPEERYKEIPRLLNGMKKLGLITDVHQTLRFTWWRHRPMRATLFDFKRGRWDFDWTQLSQKETFAVPPRTPRQRFDVTDLAILASLIGNAATPINKIAKHVRVSTKTAYRHALHIEETHMIPGYGLNWLKNQMNTDLGRPFAPQHKFAFTYVTVTGATEEEQVQLSERLSLLPFLWFEAGGSDYVAELGIPLEQMVETMSYLREVLEPVAKRSNSFIADATCSRGYSPPRKVLDESKGSWVFDVEAQMSRLDEQLKTVKKEHRK